MASDTEASCISDPNFAVICSFLEKFAKICGIAHPSFLELQEMLENTLEVAPPLVDLHVKLLRKARKSVSGERWEKALVKFCHTYSKPDGWEIERFGYKKSQLAVKLRLLKSLLEVQFDLNGRFKGAINRLNSEELRLQPIGRDKLGHTYWSQLDEECNLRVYREDLDDESWEIVARNREELVKLISQLSSNEPSNSELEAILNEDSNSLEIENPITDTGQVVKPLLSDEDVDDEAEFEEPETEDDDYFDDTDAEQIAAKNTANDKDAVTEKSVLHAVTENKQSSTIEEAAAKDQLSKTSLMQHESVVKAAHNGRELDLSNSTSKSSHVAVEGVDRKATGKILEKAEDLSQEKYVLKTSENVKHDFPNSGSDTLIQSIATDLSKHLSTTGNLLSDKPEKGNQSTATDLSTRRPSKNVENSSKQKLDVKREFHLDSESVSSTHKKQRVEDFPDQVGDAIEEPLMLVTGEGSGKDCNTGNPGKTDDTGNAIKEEKSDQPPVDDSKLDGTERAIKTNCSNDSKTSNSFAGSSMQIGSQGGSNNISSDNSKAKDSSERTDESVKCTDIGEGASDQNLNDSISIQRKVHLLGASSVSMVNLNVDNAKPSEMDSTVLETKSNSKDLSQLPSNGDKTRSSEAPLPATKRFLHLSTNTSQTTCFSNTSQTSADRISAVTTPVKTTPKLWSIDNICAPDEKTVESAHDTLPSNTTPAEGSVGNESSADRKLKPLLGVQVFSKAASPVKRSSRWDIGKPDTSSVKKVLLETSANENLLGPDGTGKDFKDETALYKSNVGNKVDEALLVEGEADDSTVSKQVELRDSEPETKLNTIKTEDIINKAACEQETGSLARTKTPDSESSEASIPASKSSTVTEPVVKPVQPSPQRFFFGPGCVQFSPKITDLVSDDKKEVKVAATSTAHKTESITTASIEVLNDKLLTDAQSAEVKKPEAGQSSDDLTKPDLPNNTTEAPSLKETTDPNVNENSSLVQSVPTAIIEKQEEETSAVLPDAPLIETFKPNLHDTKILEPLPVLVDKKATALMNSDSETKNGLIESAKDDIAFPETLPLLEKAEETKMSVDNVESCISTSPSPPVESTKENQESSELIPKVVKTEALKSLPIPSEEDIMTTITTHFDKHSMHNLPERQPGSTLEDTNSSNVDKSTDGIVCKAEEASEEIIIKEEVKNTNSIIAELSEEKVVPSLGSTEEKLAICKDLIETSSKDSTTVNMSSEDESSMSKELMPQQSPTLDQSDIIHPEQIVKSENISQPEVFDSSKSDKNLPLVVPSLIDQLDQIPPAKIVASLIAHPDEPISKPDMAKETNETQLNNLMLKSNMSDPLPYVIANKPSPLLVESVAKELAKSPKQTEAEELSISHKENKLLDETQKVLITSRAQSISDTEIVTETLPTIASDEQHINKVTTIASVSPETDVKTKTSDDGNLPAQDKQHLEPVTRDELNKITAEEERLDRKVTKAVTPCDSLLIENTHGQLPDAGICTKLEASELKVIPVGIENVDAQKLNDGIDASKKLTITSAASDDKKETISNSILCSPDEATLAAKSGLETAPLNAPSADHLVDFIKGVTKIVEPIHTPKVAAVTKAVTLNAREESSEEDETGAKVEVKIDNEVPKETSILGLSMDYIPDEPIPECSELKAKTMTSVMEVNVDNMRGDDDESQPSEADPLADYNDAATTPTKGQNTPCPKSKRKRANIDDSSPDIGKRTRHISSNSDEVETLNSGDAVAKKKGRGRPPKVKREGRPGLGRRTMVERDSSSEGVDIGADLGVDLVCEESSVDSVPVMKLKKVPDRAKITTPKKTRKVLGLEIPLEPDNVAATSSSGTPVRQSRRIAQIKIKEEAERREIEEVTRSVIEQEEKMQKKKKKPQQQISEDYSEDDEEDDDEEPDKEERKKKKRKKREKTWTRKDFNHSNPWKSSSGSSSSMEEEEEDQEQSDDDDQRMLVLKSDHEFSPESDLEDEGIHAQPLRRARTARKESAPEEPVDEAACQKCSKSDHPEWILLCDKCDAGWHCSCLRPVLFVIPEGDWYCPPCQHTTLIKSLIDQLKHVDCNSKRRNNEELRKKRLAYVGISLDNVLPKQEGKEEVATDSESLHGSAQPQSSSGSSSRSSGSSGEESEPVYQLRERRTAHFSYRFNEYDDLINSAIQDEIEAVKGAGNQGRGKDIANIIDAEREDHPEDKAVQKEKGEAGGDDPEFEPEVEAEEEEDGYIPPVTKSLSKKKHRKLNSLDTSSEDDADSDEDFKGASSDDEDDDYEEADSDDSEVGGRRRKGRGRSSGPIRRSGRARTTRFDREFIDDDSNDSDAPVKPKRGRQVWHDTSESEESDSTWGQRKKQKQKQQSSRTYAPKSSSGEKKKKKKKKKRSGIGSDEEAFRGSKPKKPRIKFGGLDEASEELITARRTRGQKINYVELAGTDSEEEFQKVSKKLESEDEYVVNEEEEDMMELEDDLKESDNESVDAPLATDPEADPMLLPVLSMKATGAGKEKSSKKGKSEKGQKRPRKLKQSDDMKQFGSDESDDEAAELAQVLEETIEHFQPEIDEEELARETKRLKKEARKLEKKELKKKGKKKKGDSDVGETPLDSDPEADLESLESPVKRKGRGRGKASFAKSAEGAELGSPGISASSSFPSVQAPPPSSGNSVISRMLQSQPVAPAPRSFTDAASAMGQKYFGDALPLGERPPLGERMPLGARGMPPSHRPPYLARSRHPLPYRQPRSPGMPHFSGVRGPPGHPNPMYHTSHHPMDPSPSGGGPITIAAPGADGKTPLGTPPPPYARGGPPPLISRFTAEGLPSNTGSPVRHPPPLFPSGSSGNHLQTRAATPPGRTPGNFSPYHQPPNYHYGAYPSPGPMGSEDALPAAAYQGPGYPDAYGSSPLTASDGSNSKPVDEEGSGEFGGLVSYFSSQREDDLDA